MGNQASQPVEFATEEERLIAKAGYDIFKPRVLDEYPRYCTHPGCKEAKTRGKRVTPHLHWDRTGHCRHTPFHGQCHGTYSYAYKHVVGNSVVTGVKTVCCDCECHQKKRRKKKVKR